MTSITFTSECPTGKVAQVCIIQENQKDPNLPPFILEAIRMKAEHPNFEFFASTPTGLQRYLIIQIQKEPSKISLEEAGAALYALICKGVDEDLLLDLRMLAQKGLDLLFGLLLASWRFQKHRSSQAKEPLRRIVVLCSNPKQLENAFKEYTSILQGIYFARELTAEPPNLLFPTEFAKRLESLRDIGVKVEILQETELKKIGMNALLAAGQGSRHSPVVAILKWEGGEKTAAPIVLVGKGVCFDSGGLCLKPPMHQLDMKWDKAGAGVVAGVLKALALAKVPKTVIGVVGLVENMPDGAAMKPGDVIKTLSGQTIEIVHTDAEGRLVLADCLWYAQQTYRPSCMVDLGTLTAETMASLGTKYAGLYANCSNLLEQLKKAGAETGEKLWELPMGSDFAKQIESDVADMKNLGIEWGGDNGAAAEFLKRFIGPAKWAHIDLSGASWTKEDTPLAPKGVTGFGVRLLLQWILNAS
jgi:leucyl aminopeptidase